MGQINGQQSDAFRVDTQLVIGGTADYVEDIIGPDIQLFMNDTNFINGGITNSDPNLYAVLFDENGINTVGNGIGHDMVAILDESSSSPIILNDFFNTTQIVIKKASLFIPFQR